MKANPGFLRAALRGALEERIPALLEIVDGEAKARVMSPKGEPVEVGPSIKDRLMAFDLLLKYGMGTPQPKLEKGTSAEQASDAELTAAFVKALRDPGVRAWLERERPEVLATMRGAV